MEIRPIDANDLRDVLVSVRNDYENNGEMLRAKAVNCAIRILEDERVAPTLDYAPVRHGEWIEKIEPYAYTASGREIHIFHCSVCDFTWANKRMVFDHFKHCPKCGAKMEEG